MRHGSPKIIEVDLDLEEDQITLTVNDDGGGFDITNNLNHGLGLGTMAERAKAINGKLQISSVPGKTTVSVTAPVGALTHQGKDDEHHAQDDSQK